MINIMNYTNQPQWILKKIRSKKKDKYKCIECNDLHFILCKKCFILSVFRNKTTLLYLIQIRGQRYCRTILNLYYL